MAPKGNGIFVVHGELSTLMTAMRRGTRWGSNSYQDDQQNVLIRPLSELKQRLNQTEDLRLIEPSEFLIPFLNIIKSEETSGPATSLALSAVNKFLSFGLIDPTHGTVTQTVENIAYAVTHARFVSTDQASDAVVLTKIVQVLRTLMLSPEGSSLTNESVCEVMLSCFRICFEPRLNESVRQSAEQALRDMVLLLFMRLPQFVEDLHPQDLVKQLKMVANEGGNPKRRKGKSRPQIEATEAPPSPPNNNPEPMSPNMQLCAVPTKLRAPALSTTPSSPAGNIVDMRGKFVETPQSSKVGEANANAEVSLDKEEQPPQEPIERRNSVENDADVEDEGDESIQLREEPEEAPKSDEYVNSVGVRFTQQSSSRSAANGGQLTPYGLPCIRELFRFLVSLCNPFDKQNTDLMIHMGLNLLTDSLEVSADSIGRYETLLAIVRDEMCRNLFFLLSTERLSIFAADLKLCFLLFESLRTHLKFQLEHYLTKVAEIVASENPKTPYETKELALEHVLRLWRIPGFATELYINYDCNLYCSNLFEDMTKLLSKIALSATQTPVFTTHILSLDALMTIIELIERNCAATQKGLAGPGAGSRHSRNNSAADKVVLNMDGGGSESGNESSTVEIEHINNLLGSDGSSGTRLRSMQATRGAVIIDDMTTSTTADPIISHDQLIELKHKKRILSQGTELFNARPEKGIQFLQENGILNPVLDPREVAHFLRENSGLDKKQIGEYVSKKKNVESKILENFVKSFDFRNMRIDAALRIYLETFRLPGEAPLISLVMEHFADHWHILNGEPFAHVDAAFGLAYAVIMLNMDQHNHNVKKMNIPMTVDDFVKNLRGMNGKADFDPEMLINIYNTIKNDEIVMPAEQTGLIRESYLWKVLLRRGASKDGHFSHVSGGVYDQEIFRVVWGPTLAALSFMFDKSPGVEMMEKALNGFSISATIASTHNLTSDFDALILTLCKFTTIVNPAKELNDIQLAAAFGCNQKANLATKTMFGLVQKYGDCMRDSWRNILEVLGQLFKLRLLPKSLVEVEDFCQANGKLVLVPERINVQRPDAGLFSSLYLYLSSDNQREPSVEESSRIKAARKCINECRIDQIIKESKFLQQEALEELLRCLAVFLAPPQSHKSVATTTRYEEDMVVFMMEILIRVLIENRDRLLHIWDRCKQPLYTLLHNGGQDYCQGYDQLLLRTTVGILKLSAYLMRNEELCPVVLQSLKAFLRFGPAVLLKLSKPISIGVYELLKTSAQNIHTEQDWAIIFAILECVGAGAVVKMALEQQEEQLDQKLAKSDGALSSNEDNSEAIQDRGYTSDSELMTRAATSPKLSPSDNWILVNSDTAVSEVNSQSPVKVAVPHSLAYPCKLMDHSPYALVKCWDSLAFIVRNVAHITPYNFEGCVKCIRTFVEASISIAGNTNGRVLKMEHAIRSQLQMNSQREKSQRDGEGGATPNDNEKEIEDLSDRYPTIAIQLLDIMHTLHTRTAQIFRWWAEEGGAIPQCSTLWATGWCPLLQGIARLVTDERRAVRTYAITCLQRALLVHDLQTLTGAEWKGCFKQVLFPLLSTLLAEQQQVPGHAALLEESRMRTATIMSKVFLHHLTPLITLADFPDLWLEILEYLERFMRAGSDMLYEAMLEGLKNMLLVMHSVRVFHNADGVTHSPLWDLTWQKIGQFLPQLKVDLFKEETPAKVVAMAVPETTISMGIEIPTVQFQPEITGQHHHQQQRVEDSVMPVQVVVENVRIDNPIENGQAELNTTVQMPMALPNQMVTLETAPELQPDSNSYNYRVGVPAQNDLGDQPNPKPGIVMASSPTHHQNTLLSSMIDPPVPISHLMGGNQYPSLAKLPPPNIAQSYAPMFVQPQPQPVGGDIYNDYVNDPYNLTLPADPQVINSSPDPENPGALQPINRQGDEHGADGAAVQTLGASNVFQLSNYFSSDSTKVIPPGSEILFGEP